MGINADVSCIIIFQIIISAISQILLPSDAKTRMPIATVKHVELFCNFQLPSLIAPLCYNLLLIIACAVHGFITRKLPENFNESKFIFRSVSTTCFLWAVFLPTYFTLFYAVHKTTILAYCLLMNSLITLICLFCPKVYVVYFVGESSSVHPTGKLSTCVATTNNMTQ